MLFLYIIERLTNVRFGPDMAWQSLKHIVQVSADAFVMLFRFDKNCHSLDHIGISVFGLYLFSQISTKCPVNIVSLFLNDFIAK